MLSKLLAPIIAWMTSLMGALGPFGVMLLMAIESACIPIPSEVIMPFAGYLAYQDKLTLFGFGAGSPVLQIAIAAVFGALGCNLGSIPAYEVGARGGHPAVARYGKYVFLNMGHLEMAHRFFERHGGAAVFIGRLLPMVRTFIALPAGIAEMDRRKFHIYTFAGSLPWCLGLAILGYKLGEHWHTLGAYFHRFDLAIAILLLAGAAWFLLSHWRQRTRG